MGKKDLSEKKLEDYNDVFADIFNTLLFGNDELDFKRLKAGPTASIYKVSGEEVKEQFRDTLKEYQNSERYIIAAYGIENPSLSGCYNCFEFLKYEMEAQEKFA